MNRNIIILALLLLAVFATALAFADDAAPPVAPPAAPPGALPSAPPGAPPVVPWPTFDLRMRNYVMYQNNTDFDPTKPLNNRYGLAIGYFATTIEPGLRWTPIPQVTVRYQAKIGENVWSRNNAEELDMTAPDTMLFQTEEAWSEVRLPGNVAIRAGYQFMHDPTRLFLDRHIGAAVVSVGWTGGSVSAIVGQLPNSFAPGSTGEPPSGELTTTYEPPTTNLDQNTFADSAIVYAVRADLNAGAWLVIPAVYALNDRIDPYRVENLVNPCAHVEGPLAPAVKLQLDAAVQAGGIRHGGVADHDVNIFAYAGQVNVDMDWRPVRARFNAMVFSGDDQPNGLTQENYVYSGWSRSSTLMLAENKLQDQYNNLDEVAAGARAGMALVDGRVGYFPVDSLEIFGVAGWGRAMAAGLLDTRDPTIATEGDLGLAWQPYGPVATFTLAAIGLWPGKSGAMLVNDINLKACRTIYNGQALMDIKF
jgi:hypothetical protein